MKKYTITDAQDAIAQGILTFHTDKEECEQILDDLVKEQAYYEVEVKFDKRNIALLRKAIRLLAKVE